MMVERWAYLLLVRALVFAEAAKSLQKVTNQTVITIQNVQIPESSISLNQSLTTSNSSIDNRMDFVCDALIYGASLDLRDCQEALNFFHSSDDDHAWVDRRGGHGGTEFQLPFRMMGTDAASCYLQPKLKISGGVGHSSFNDIRRAGSALISQCITNARLPTGGIASNIGSDGTMDLILSEYAPKARCRQEGTIPPDFTTYCQAVIGAMLATRQTQVFGPASDPASEIVTPTFIQAGIGQCVLRVYTPESSDSISWFSLWEETTAIYSYCIRKGRTGYSSGLGANGKVLITLGPGEPQTSNMSQLSTE
ncbi:hypothetical protein JMJ35_003315 [Cladonia borealis]|uniref:Uncharacterized protein n=1 Tax=Cladonia borealis TaxID=184061 RepID=A0AA39R4H1_9LECA|nr:hypothetical protein JMJ35_003315 [Cladonia borealis]